MTGCGQCDCGVICEEHPHMSWPHDDCAGPGVPCTNPDCAYSIVRTGLISPKCRQSYGVIQMETHRVIRFRCSRVATSGTPSTVTSREIERCTDDTR